MSDFYEGFSLLLGEDDKVDAHIMQLVLKEMNFKGEFTHLKKGQEILDWVLKRNQYKSSKHGLPDMIILDIGLPVVSGLDVLKNLRQHDESKGIPIIMCSGSISLKDYHQCIALGSNAYIQKNENIEVFSKSVRLFIEAWYGITHQHFFSCEHPVRVKNTILNNQRMRHTMGSVNILLVDDQLSSLLALEDILETLDATLLKAGSARQALRMMMENSIDCVLLDVSMPEMDGFDFLQTLKNAPTHRSVPVIMVTGKVFSENETLRAYQGGAVDFLLKPLDSAMVYRKVSFFVEQARRIKSLENVATHLNNMQHEIIGPLLQLNESDTALKMQLNDIISHLCALQQDWLISESEKSL